MVAVAEWPHTSAPEPISVAMQTIAGHPGVTLPGRPEDEVPLHQLP